MIDNIELYMTRDVDYNADFTHPMPYFPKQQHGLWSGVNHF